MKKVDIEMIVSYKIRVRGVRKCSIIKEKRLFLLDLEVPDAVDGFKHVEYTRVIVK